MFADVSGFTSLIERLSKHGKVGAEEMNDLLDAVFTEVLSVAYDYGAGVIKWGGDATLLLFTGDHHAPRACRAAAEMQRTMRKVGRLRTPAGTVTLRMSIGIHSGLFDFFFVGKLHRELVVTGPAVNETVASESASEADEIVVSPATAAMLEPGLVGPARGPGYLLAGAPRLEVDRTSAVGDVDDIDLVRCVPVAISGHLIDGGGEAEHRPLTIAFIGFGGTDELLASEGPEAVADALEQCLDTVEGIALEHKVAFFDTDVAAGRRQDHARLGRADEQRQGRGAHDAVVACDRRLRLPLPLQIGVDRGRLFAADFGPPYRRTYSFKGDAANLAARLMAKAAPGQILSTEEVLTRSRTEFDVEPSSRSRSKGSRNPCSRPRRIRQGRPRAACRVAARRPRAGAPHAARSGRVGTTVRGPDRRDRRRPGDRQVAVDRGVAGARRARRLHLDPVRRVRGDDPYHPFQLSSAPCCTGGRETRSRARG